MYFEVRVDEVDRENLLEGIVLGVTTRGPEDVGIFPEVVCGNPQTVLFDGDMSSRR